MAQPSGYNMFFLRTVRSLPKAPPAVVYNNFYKKIQQRQLNEIKTLKKAFDIIDKNVREINVVTEDPEMKNKISWQTQILMKVDRELREAHVKNDSEFLNALDTVLKFKPEE